MFFSKCVWIMKRQPIPVGEVFEDHSVSAVMIIKQVTVYNPRSAKIKIWSSHSFGSWIHIYRIEAPSCLASFSFPAPRICPRSSHPSMAYIPCFVCIIQSHTEVLPSHCSNVLYHVTGCGFISAGAPDVIRNTVSFLQASKLWLRWMAYSLSTASFSWPETVNQ